MAYRYSEEELLEEISRLHNDLGRVPKAQDMTDHGAYGENTYSRRFGSWNESLEKAGFYPQKERDISNDDLEREMERVAEEYHNGDTPKASTMREYGEYSTAVYLDRFGSWNDAIEECGFKTNFHQNITENELILELKRISEKYFNGYAPTYNSMEDHGKYGKSTYERYFGTWNHALELAGFILNKRRIGNARSYDYGPSWYKQRKAVRKRDGGKCRVCNESKIIADVHHIKPAKYWNIEEEHENMNSLNNLICLCRSCHQKLEGKWQNASPEEFKKKGKEFMGIGEEKEENRRSLFNY